MCVLSDYCKTDSPNLKEKLCKQKIGFLQSLTFVDLQAGRVVRKSMGRSVRTKTHVPQSRDALMAKSVDAKHPKCFT